MPANSDACAEANYPKQKCFRKELCHSISTDIPTDELESKRNKICQPLVALGLDQQGVDHLNTEPIDHDNERQLKEKAKNWKLEFEPRVES